jgi:hypothetical protein
MQRLATATGGAATVCQPRFLQQGPLPTNEAMYDWVSDLNSVPAAPPTQRQMELVGVDRGHVHGKVQDMRVGKQE